MENILTFKPAAVDYTPAVVTSTLSKDYEWEAGTGLVLVLKPEVRAVTASGINLSDTQIAEELKKMDFPMTILKVGQGINLNVGVNTKAVVNRFTVTHLPSPIEGFDVVAVREHEILAFDNTSRV